MSDDPHRRDDSDGHAGEPRGLSPWAVPHFAAFAVVLGVWTWLLLEPYPVPPVIAEGLGASLRLILAKTLHAGVYAFLTVLGATLPVSRRWRVAVVVFLALHGVGTEIGQTFVKNRVGKVTDVLIDWAGVALGVLALRWWQKPRRGDGLSG
jgi:hypothetical protein